MVETLIITAALAFLALLIAWAGLMQRRYIKRLRRLAARRGLTQLDTPRTDAAALPFIATADGIELSYRRPQRSAMSVASGRLWDEVSASTTYRRHLIALALEAPAPAAASALAARIQALAASFQWTPLEQALEGRVQTVTAGPRVGLMITLPLFRPALADRIEALLDAAMDLGAAHG